MWRSIGPALRPRHYTLIFLMAVFVLAGSSVIAGPPNYQKYIIGERALGMGGAYVAAVNDPIASYYNPGGMSFSGSTMISASQGVYSLDYRHIKDGFIPLSLDATDAKTLEHKHDLTFPSTLALMIRFGPELYAGGPKRHAIGVSVLVPYQDSYTLKAKWEREGPLRDSETYTLSESYRLLWTGLSYGVRISKEWGLGLSAFLSNYRYKRRLDTSRVEDMGGLEDESCGLYRCGYLEFNESALDITVVSLIFRLGALWAPHKNWRFGLTVTPPSIPLNDIWLMETKGSMDQTAGAAYVTATGNDYIEYYTDDYSLDVKGQIPTSFSAGGAFLWKEQVTLDLDVTVHLPVTYEQIHGDPVEERSQENPSANPEWVDKGIIRTIERKAVANVNLGGEWLIANHWTLRGGVFSDFSSAPDVTYSAKPQLTKVHRFGASLSGGYQARGYDVTVGVTGSFGHGKASIYNFSQDDTSRSWQPAEYEERAIYVFIAGVQSAVAETGKKIWKRVKEGKTEAPAPRVEDGTDTGIIDDVQNPPPLSAKEKETPSKEMPKENEDGAIAQTDPMNREGAQPVQDEQRPQTNEELPCN